jgi:hypothetical protein
MNTSHRPPFIREGRTLSDVEWTNRDNLRTAKGILLGVFIGLCLWVGGFCLEGVMHHG